MTLRRNWIILLCLCFIAACKSKGQDKPSDLLATVPSEPLPFHYSYLDNIGDIYTLNDFLKNEKYTGHAKLDSLFSPGTTLTMREGQYGHPYSGKARFFKRLPDVHGKKVLLFAYWDQQTDYKLPTIELQTFDNQLKVIDKMIVVDGTNYECSWNRSFTLSKDYVLNVKDEDVCWDIENGKKASDKTKTHTYTLDPDGKIRPQGSSTSAPVISDDDLSRWQGGYTLHFPTGEQVTNASGNSVNYVIDIDISISKDSIVYEEKHTKSIYNRYHCKAVLDKNVLNLECMNGTEKALGSITRDKDQYYFKPGKASNFSSIEPIPAQGILLIRRGKK